MDAAEGGLLDRDLVELAQRGDREAFAILARTHGDRLMQIAAVGWSPTGEWISYARFHGRTSVVSLIRPDGTDLREISANDETDEANSPAWSSDGKFLLVARDSNAIVDGPQDLWIMDLKGNYIGQVTDEPSTYGTYSWAPDPG